MVRTRSGREPNLLNMFTQVQSKVRAWRQNQVCGSQILLKNWTESNFGWLCSATGFESFRTVCSEKSEEMPILTSPLISITPVKNGSISSDNILVRGETCLGIFTIHRNVACKYHFYLANLKEVSVARLDWRHCVSGRQWRLQQMVSLFLSHMAENETDHLIWWKLRTWNTHNLRAHTVRTIFIWFEWRDEASPCAIRSESYSLNVSLVMNISAQLRSKHQQMYVKRAGGTNRLRIKVHGVSCPVLQLLDHPVFTTAALRT